jgi:hypothetical protein
LRDPFPFSASASVFVSVSASVSGGVGASVAPPSDTGGATGVATMVATSPLKRAASASAAASCAFFFSLFLLDLIPHDGSEGLDVEPITLRLGVDVLDVVGDGLPSSASCSMRDTMDLS